MRDTNNGSMINGIIGFALAVIMFAFMVYGGQYMTQYCASTQGANNPACSPDGPWTP